ncbi:GPS-CTERM domain-containing protein, partial [Streptomyces mirabilis]
VASLRVRAPASSVFDRPRPIRASTLRYDTNALLCAISGYPGKGCGDQVATSHTAPAITAKADAKDNTDATSEPTRHGPSLGLLAGVVAVAALGGAAVWRTRRRRP